MKKREIRDVSSLCGRRRGGTFPSFALSSSRIRAVYFSFILALILQKPVNFLEKKCRVPRALSSALLMLLLLGLLCRGIAALLAVLIRESADFISELTSGDADYLAEISALADKIGGAVDRIIRDIFPAAEGVDTAGMMRSLFLSALSAAATTVSRWVAHTVSAMPRALVFLLFLYSPVYIFAPIIRKYALLSQASSRAG